MENKWKFVIMKKSSRTIIDEKVKNSDIANTQNDPLLHAIQYKREPRKDKSL